ncbi:MAG: HD family hydrolase [Promethearchaeota archaeon]
MKRLLRQGWVRTGVPLSSIESLADHSWSVAVLTFIFSTMENSLRETGIPKLDIQKAVLIALFHDFHESESFDIDKSVNFVSSATLEDFQRELEEGAIQNILSKVPSSVKAPLSYLLTDQKSEEYHIARVSDLIDFLYQTEEYGKKHWIDEYQFKEFKSNALHQLNQYKGQFSFLEKFLLEI